MRELNTEGIEHVTGGLKIEEMRQSPNVWDCTVSNDSSLCYNDSIGYFDNPSFGPGSCYDSWDSANDTGGLTPEVTVTIP